MKHILLNKRGNRHFSLGQYDKAITFYEKAISIKSNYAKAYYNLGQSYHQLGQLDKAVKSFKMVVEIKPEFAGSHNNKILSVIYYFPKGQIPDAVDLLEILIKESPSDALLYNMLGGCFVSMCEPQLAIVNYQKALDLMPEYSIPRHMLNSLTGQTSKEPPREYVKNLFDDYAHRFNDSLVNNLQYNLPFIIKELILELNKEKLEFNNVIDLGCGTGLAGKSLRDISSNLTGVDVSKNMISEAKKLDIYDNLLVGDIVEELSLMEDKFDLLIALDVLIYVGDAKSIFQIVRKSCQLDSLFIFSVEIQEENGYALLKSARYAHSDRYIMEQTSGIFELIDSQHVRLRKEGDNWINGKVYVFQPI
jgi:predicted TPR repeat methyltransferase